MIHIVTDSTADLSPADAGRLGVTVVPLTVRFGEEQFQDGVDLDSDAFYAKLASSSVNPTTSQPTPEQFQRAYAPLLQNPEDQVVSLHISGKLSGTLQSANIARQELDAGRIHLVDSETVSAGLQFLVQAAAEDIAAGLDAGTVAQRAEARRSKVTIYVLLDTLTYLQRGGRIGRAQALIGSLLGVKPLLTTKDGEVGPQARVRSRRQGIEMITELLQERLPLRRVAAFHCGAPELLPVLEKRLRAALPDVEIVTGQVGPVVGVYTGPGGVGIAALAPD
ncbi:MAG: DegV family protein [Candidatus Dormibacteraeota bacterium]|nr:DegV family protein [Candidatus Dormibacteraeota bacterium]